VVMEGSSGKLSVTGSCVRGVRNVAGSAPIQQSGNRPPPCGGTPPPPTSTTTTTRPPTPSSTTTTTTTTVPPTPRTCADRIKDLEDERVILKKIIRNHPEASTLAKNAEKLQDRVHDELVALKPAC